MRISQSNLSILEGKIVKPLFRNGITHLFPANKHAGKTNLVMSNFIAKKYLLIEQKTLNGK